MGQNNRQYHGATVAEFLPQDQLEAIKKFAQEPQGLEEKLNLYAQYATEHEVANPKDPKRKDRRSRLGSFINKMFNTELVLPSTAGASRSAKQSSSGRNISRTTPKCPCITRPRWVLPWNTANGWPALAASLRLSSSQS